MFKVLLFSPVFILVFLLNGFSQEKESHYQLSVDSIMQTTQFWFRDLPEDFQWAPDGSVCYFSWQGPGDSTRQMYQYNPGKEKLLPATEQEVRQLLPYYSAYSPDKAQILYVEGGDLWLHTIKSNHRTLLMQHMEGLREPHFVTKTKVAFRIRDDLYTLDLSSHLLKRIVDFREEPEPGSTQDKASEKWLKQQQKQLFRAFQEEEKKSKEAKAIPIVYSDDFRIRSVRMACAGEVVSFQMYKRDEGASTEVPYYVHQSGYTKVQAARPKVGTNEPADIQVGIFLCGKDSMYVVNTDSLPGIKDYPDYYQDYDRMAPDVPRKVQTYGPFWSNDGRSAILDIRSVDNKDRWIALLDPETGELTVLDRQQDEAWIGGPGMHPYGGGAVNWMPDNKHIWFLSEVSGFVHVYTMNVETLERKAVTSGKYEIYNPALSANGKYWYYHSNQEHTGERHFYRQQVGSDKQEQLTSGEGRHDVIVSPNDKWMAIRYSTATTPWEFYVQPLKPNKPKKRVTRSTTEKFAAYPWRRPKFVSFPASDGALVPARLYLPEKPNGAAIMFVHGAGYLQNAHKWWSNYFREYMFHNFLADQGYTVLDVDYRGSAGYGRDWRTAIYRHMGGRDLQDYVDGANWLVENHQVEAERIGIYGGSYGGFITLMALFTESEAFAAGAALRSVTDWAHYNHGYTSNILNTPTLDSMAYYRSSPINFAHGLNDPLLMCHGMIDMNVHFQDIVRLSQRFIELGKENWELAVYPVERHSFTEPESWTDEYQRIWKLFRTHLGSDLKKDLSEN
ncbi:MAG: S9 family peptidase [Bacteroidota bacterium]